MISGGIQRVEGHGVAVDGTVWQCVLVSRIVIVKVGFLVAEVPVLEVVQVQHFYVMNVDIATCNEVEVVLRLICSRQILAV